MGVMKRKAGYSNDSMRGETAVKHMAMAEKSNPTRKERALSEFIRVLKQEGRVVIVDLCAPKKRRSLSAKIMMPIFKQA